MHCKTNYGSLGKNEGSDKHQLPTNKFALNRVFYVGRSLLSVAGYPRRRCKETKYLRNRTIIFDKQTMIFDKTLKI